MNKHADRLAEIAEFIGKMNEEDWLHETRVAAQRFATAAAGTQNIEFAQSVRGTAEVVESTLAFKLGLPMHSLAKTTECQMPHDAAFTVHRLTIGRERRHEPAPALSAQR
ncbi:MAG: hypothetical protein AB7P97_19280 [Hyphomonadaceae bacterium]